MALTKQGLCGILICMDKNKLISIASEFLPVIVFFVLYKMFGIVTASISIVITSLVCTSVNYIYNKSISPVSILSTVLIIIFGLITVISHNGKFIQIKPTILYLTFAGILLIGIMRGKGYIKHIFMNMILPDHAWITLSRRFSLFFTFLAITNECARIFLSEAAWVNFKVFGVTIISIIFILLQLPFLIRHRP